MRDGTVHKGWAVGVATARGFKASEEFFQFYQFVVLSI